MKLALVVRCLTEPCVVCTREVHTCELGTCPEGFAHLEGSQLSSKKWVCSQVCYEVATAPWPPKRDRLTVPSRILAGVGLTLAATSFMVPAAGLQLGLALSALLSCSMCVLFAALEKKAEPRGKVMSRGVRR